MQFSNILLWISESLTSSDHENQMPERCSTVMQWKSKADIFMLWRQELHWMYDTSLHKQVIV